jgi:GT2 family glycosyltransferase
VAAIVLSYNGREVTLEALASLARMDYPAYQLVVVDNGSEDGTREAVAAAYPQVVVLRTEVNRGPAGGANLGLCWALDRGYDYLLVLNNDIEVEPALLAELVAVAESAPDIGIVGPKGYYFWDRERIWSAGGRLRFAEAITRERGEGELDHGQYDRTEEVDYINGCVMLVKRECFEAAGLWDPVFRLAVEDADFCWRVKARGYRCFYAPRARFWHMVSRSTGGYKPAKTFQTARSTAIFVRRYAGPWQWARALFWIAVSLPAAYLRELPRGNQQAVSAKLRGFREGFSLTLPEPPRYLPQTAAREAGPGAVTVGAPAPHVR